MEHRKRGERIQRGESMEVTVAGQTMHAVRWGAGTPVIFLSGSSVLFPWMEYGTFLEECSAFCQVTLMERLGYGNSTIPKGPRTIGGAVAEYRQAWKVLGGPQPVVVMAHSMGFLEALHWAQSAPKEVRALIGFDGATPESYRMFPIERAARTLDLLAKQPLAALLIPVRHSDPAAIPAADRLDGVAKREHFDIAANGSLAHSQLCRQV